ncbi:MAG TPA: hypothetical protein VKU38_02765 [Ktedonobacteraceae bacterium]|nr:hypothetical protein [Ktedonobacteraceae bacterium]
MKNPVFVLWLGGVHPTLLSQVPAVSGIVASGTDLQLTPAPLVEKSGCYYQTLTGMKPGKLGHFDSVYPENYQVNEDTSAPYGAAGRLLPDILRSRRLATTFLEVKAGESFSQLANKHFDCTILHLLAMEHASVQQIDDIVRQCLEIAGPEAHFLLLTDVASEEPRAYVNINDFLADIGLLDVGEPRSRDTIVWPQTLAFGVGAGQVWVNLSGRESQGAVGTDEYQEVCEAVIQELSTNWLDPVSNEPVVQQVLSREDIFAGDYVFKAPDLAVIFRPGYALSANAIRLDFDGKSVIEGKRDATEYAPYARLIASGPNIAAGARGTGMLIDVMPSLLYLLNQPVPEDIDGTIISTLFTESYRKQTPIRYIEGDEALLSNEEEGVIVDRLRDLGYI